MGKKESTKNTTEIENKTYNFELLNFANTNIMKLLLKWLPIISLTISDFIIVLIFSQFFNISFRGIYFWIIFMVSFVFSLITIKTPFLLEALFYIKKKCIGLLQFIKKDKRNKKLEQGNDKFPVDFKLDWVTSIILIVKGVFFNLLNDLFILLIINTTIIAVFWGFDTLKLDKNFNILISTIILIGTFSGLYQFYIKNYKENVSKNINNAISNYIESHLKRISFGDFLKTLENNKKSDREGIDDVRDLLYSEKNINLPSTGGFRTRKYVVEIPSYFNNLGFLHLEDFIKFKKDSHKLDQTKLNSMYSTYFDLKLEEFRNKLNSSKEDLMELRNTLVSEIIFFDEILVNIQKLNLEQSLQERKQDDDEKEYSFMDYYGNFQTQCLNELLKFLFKGKVGGQHVS